MSTSHSTAAFVPNLLANAAAKLASAKHHRMDALSASCLPGGWLIGVGAEYAFWQNVSAKIEFDNIDFGSRNITTSDAAGDFVIFNIGQRLNILKTGINY